MMPQFLLIALGTLVSEDLTCIATGVLIAQKRIGPVEGTLGCLLGILTGDIALFALGRIAGDRRVLGRWVPAERISAASAWIERSGWKVVLVSRFTPGLRLPTYLAAGLLRSRFWAFAGYFLLAAVLWTPLLVGATAALGEQALRSALAKDSPFTLVVLIATIFGASRLRDFETRRRLLGFLRRKLQWEFWPSWAVYVPLAPYFMYLAIRYRSVTLFTGANPGMFAGGLVGESKSEILGHLSRIPGAVAPFRTIPRGTTVPVDRFPAVLKPDVGERGAGVTIVRSQEDADRYLRSATSQTILQEYVPGCEFGVYYVRFPDEARGRVLYVTEKRFPALTGDGRHTLRQLILRDTRAVCMADAYFQASTRPLDAVPAAGEDVQLVEIGSHCRGTVFLDGSRWISPALTDAVDRVSRAHPGFHIGRYDVRAVSAGALQRGEFKVIELNGVAAEATHVYDPAIPLWTKYRVLARHWRTAYEIGAIHRSRGVRPMSLRELWQLLFPSPVSPLPVTRSCES